MDYTLNQLDQMRQQGTPLTMQVGDTISDVYKRQIVYHVENLLSMR